MCCRDWLIFIFLVLCWFHIFISTLYFHKTNDNHYVPIRNQKKWSWIETGPEILYVKDGKLNERPTLLEFRKILAEFVTGFGQYITSPPSNCTPPSSTFCGFSQTLLCWKICITGQRWQPPACKQMFWWTFSSFNTQQTLIGNTSTFCPLHPSFSTIVMLQSQ